MILSKKMELHSKIISGKATTTVLGTSFNVRAYPDEEKIEVAVETGVVELQESEKVTNKVKLVAGNSGYFNKRPTGPQLTKSKIKMHRLGRRSH